MSHSQDGKIKDVWEENMVDELRKISELIEDYNYVSMVIYIIIQDTEFPGIVYPVNSNTLYTTKNLDQTDNKDKVVFDNSTISGN